MINNAKRNTKQTVYARAEKTAAEAVLEDGLSYGEAEWIYGINVHDRIQQWERIYLTEGAEGLAVDRRGRARTASGGKKGYPAKLQKEVEEDLLGDVQRLRAEVDYLKNLYALVLVDQRCQRKKCR